jgi:phosphoglycerol geranylgeranyltransferase
MKQGKIERYIYEKLESSGAMLFCLIDPIDYKSEEIAIDASKLLAKGGADIMLIGGSTEVQGELLDSVVKSIKESVDIPVILFPANISSVTRHADAIYFMSLLNARNPYWITQAQMLSAPTVKKFGIEPIPIGYIVVYPGGTVGWVSDANFIPREKPKLAASLAMAGEFLGNRFILTDTGSNPKLQNSGHVPEEMIRAVKSAITVPYIVGGGISTVDDLRNVFSSGADIAQIGTAFDQNPDKTFQIVKSFAKVTKEEGLKKLRA